MLAESGRLNTNKQKHSLQPSNQSHRQTDPPPTFSTPFVPFVPLLGVTVNIILILALSADAYWRVLVWTIVGVLIYLFYGVRHSKLNPFEEVEGSDDYLFGAMITDGDHEPPPTSLD